MIKRVIATDADTRTHWFLKKKHGPLMFHQSGGCCDGSSPMCYPDGELIIGEQDVLLGHIGDAPFYMHKNQFDYWKHTQLIIDVVRGAAACFHLRVLRENVFKPDLAPLRKKKMKP